MLFKKILAISVLIFISLSKLWAGDVAVFVDLGFSADGRAYMFGQYGVLSPSLRPWAEIFVVDVPANNFVPNGRLAQTQQAPIRAGQDGSGAFFRLLADNTAFAARHGVNFVNQGQPLYISRDENPPAAGEKIDFRDFVSGNSYNAELIPTIRGSGMNTTSSFIINMQVRNSSGQVRNYTVGTPQVVRQRVASYNIKRVLIDAGGNSIIFVIEMRRVSETGHDIRYMIEAQRL